MKRVLSDAVGRIIMQFIRCAHAEAQGAIGHILAVEVIQCRSANMLIQLALEMPTARGKFGFFWREFDGGKFDDDSKSGVFEAVDKVSAGLGRVVNGLEDGIWEFWASDNSPFVFGRDLLLFFPVV
jgi:hypothetical protein